MEVNPFKAKAHFAWFAVSVGIAVSAIVADNPKPAGAAWVCAIAAYVLKPEREDIDAAVARKAIFSALKLEPKATYLLVLDKQNISAGTAKEFKRVITEITGQDTVLYMTRGDVRQAVALLKVKDITDANPTSPAL